MNKIQSILIFVGWLAGVVAFGQGAHFHNDSSQKCITFKWRPFEAGIEVGPAMTCFWSNNPQLNYQQDLQYSSGIFFRYNANYWIGFQSGVNIERIGRRSEFKWADYIIGAPGTGYVKNQNDYLTFPLLVRFSAIEKRMSLNFTIGGFLSYLFYSKEIVSPYPPGTPGDPNPGKENISESTQDLNRFNGGLAGGVGLDYKFNFGLNVGLEIRDQLGLAHIPNNGPVSKTYIRTNSLQCLLRISWKFGIDTQSTICSRSSTTSRMMKTN